MCHLLGVSHSDCVIIIVKLQQLLVFFFFNTGMVQPGGNKDPPVALDFVLETSTPHAAADSAATTRKFFLSLPAKLESYFIVISMSVSIHYRMYTNETVM